MTKDYMAGVVDLTGDDYLNPPQLVWNDNEGSHARDVSKITSISIHHDATERPHDYDSIARYKAEAAEHYQRLGMGLQYHYRIDNTGNIFKIRPWTTWLNCVGSAENVTTLAICLDGNLSTQLPTLEQCEALFQLLKVLCTEHPEFPATWPDVRPHADFSPTECPGNNERPYVLAIKDETTALQFPANTGYDWPEYQPGSGQPSVDPGTPDPDVTVKQSQIDAWLHGPDGIDHWKSQAYDLGVEIASQDQAIDALHEQVSELTAQLAAAKPSTPPVPTPPAVNPTTAPQPRVDPLSGPPQPPLVDATSTSNTPINNSKDTSKPGSLLEAIARFFKGLFGID